MIAAKRLFDIVVSVIFLAILSPLLLIIPILIKLDSRGPVFYIDERAGKGGKAFGAIKFRTMVVGAANMGLGRLVAENDARITRVGRVLRRWTLDEIPQFFDVLRGEMSVVGPRPATPDQMARCTPRQRRRLEVKPGMAGWAWIHGRNNIPWSQRIELDIWYIDHWSFWLDLYLVAKTLLLVFKREGVYGPSGLTRDIDWTPADNQDKE